MTSKWIVRLTIQAVTGIVALFLADRLLPGRAKTEDYKAPGIILAAAATALVLADGFFAAAAKKLDEPLNLPSFSMAERSAIRADLSRTEKSLTASFIISTVAKGVFGAIGLIFTTQAMPDVTAYARLFCLGFFLLGFAVPTLILMPSAYFNLKAARIELAEMEEEKAAKVKLLDSLQNAPAHDFEGDEHFAAFGRVIDSGE